jgi:hypothetical protein
MPASADQGRHDIVCVSDQNQIEGIAVFVPVGVCGAARELFDQPAQFFFVFDVDDLFRIIQRVEIDHLEIGFKIRVGDDE